jgi:hypothetical protein
MKKTGKKESKKTKKEFPDAPPEKCFWVNDGSILKNLRELPSALKQMPRETFVHHVNRGKNDFAEWIDKVIGEKRLANQVRQFRSKAGMIKAIESRLK